MSLSLRRSLQRGCLQVAPLILNCMFVNNLQEVYALLLTHAPHLLAGSPMDFQRALGRSSTLLHDAESLYIKYMSASARYSVR